MSEGDIEKTWTNDSLVGTRQGVNSTVAWSKMLHILDILLHKFQLV